MTTPDEGGLPRGLSEEELFAIMSQMPPENLSEDGLYYIGPPEADLTDATALPRGLSDEELALIMSEAPVDSLTEEEQYHGHSLKYVPGRHHFFGAVPVFLVDDIAATCAYYEVVLGFEINFTYGDPASFACVSRNNAMINLNCAQPPGRRNSAASSGSAGADAYLLVNDIDDLYAELQGRGAHLLSGLVEQPYGMREFQVEDLNGYRLTLAEGMFT